MITFLLSLCALGVPLEPSGPAPLVSTERLVETIRSLPEKRAALGSPEHREGLRKAESLLADRLRELGLTPVMHAFTWGSPGAEIDDPADEGQITWHNIIIDLPGTDLKHEVLVVGAHFDAVPMGPGADDNATGTAAALELARILRDFPTRRTIRIAFFNLEEVGLVGSTAYAADWKKAHRPAPPAPDEPPAPTAADAPNPETIVGMLSLEMLGYFSDEPNSQKSPIPSQPGVFEAPTVGDSIALVGIVRDQAFIRELSLAMLESAPGLRTTVVDFVPVALPDMTRSDHRPFMALRVPALMVTDTANFRNPHYHKATDTLETLDLTRFTLVVRGLAGAVHQIALPEPGAKAP